MFIRKNKNKIIRFGALRRRSGDFTRFDLKTPRVGSDAGLAGFVSIFLL